MKEHLSGCVVVAVVQYVGRVTPDSPYATLVYTYTTRTKYRRLTSRFADHPASRQSLIIGENI